MSKPKSEQALEQKAELFKALGHPIRVLIINLVQIKPRHGEELATILRLKPATISHHLSKLTEVGVLQAQKDQYYQMYSLVKGALNKTLLEIIQMPATNLAERVETDAYRQKVMDTFFRQGRLIKIPAQLKKQQVVLSVIVEEFEPERPYSEIEVNRILIEFHEDVATLRRGLVEHQLMTREKGIYQRTVSASSHK